MAGGTGGGAWARSLVSYARAHRPRSWRHAIAVVALYVTGWAVVAVPVAYHLFMTDSRSSVVAGHDVVVSPTHDGWATFDLGALLPDVRYPRDQWLGVHIDVGATNVDSYDTLIDRYAVIASQPAGEVDKVTGLVRDMAYDAMVKGALVGLVGPVLWLLVGRRRRTELWSALTTRRGLAITATGALVAGLVVWPFGDNGTSATVSGSNRWEPIAQLLPETTIEGEAARLQVQGGLITTGTKRLIQSAFDTYGKSRTYYHDLADRAPALAAQLHQPREDETVALVVTDRHDNIGMDQVSRAIGDAGGATILFDAGDDTSTGEQWEAFSLDSVATAFDGYQRYGVAGNHDNGSFVSDYLTDLGFTMLNGEPVKAADGIRLLGAPDPRSSGLGDWTTVGGISLEEQEHLLADAACRADDEGKRIATLLVHDASQGGEALDRGCVDLVLGGHLHVQAGPTIVRGETGSVGTTYTTGTTGGAAYAFALGSKLRRDAEVSLVTYRDGRPVGIQPVMISTTGVFSVEPYVPLPSTDSRDAQQADN